MLYLAFEDVEGFFVDKATSRKDVDRKFWVRPDEGDTRIIGMSFRRSWPLPFVDEGLYSVQDMPSDKEFGIAIHAAT